MQQLCAQCFKIRLAAKLRPDPLGVTSGAYSNPSWIFRKREKGKEKEKEKRGVEQRERRKSFPIFRPSLCSVSSDHCCYQQQQQPRFSGHRGGTSWELRGLNLSEMVDPVMNSKTADGSRLYLRCILACEWKVARTCEIKLKQICFISADHQRHCFISVLFQLRARVKQSAETIIVHIGVAWNNSETNLKHFRVVSVFYFHFVSHVRASEIKLK